MGILDDLVNQKPRETSGSAAFNRFRFQINWAFSKLVELQKEKKPYLIILDLHEDVVIADSDVAPTRFDFYQVKTKKTGPWREADLLRRQKPKKPDKGKKDKPLSILGKLYLHRVKFPDIPGTLAFVSNAPCKLSFDARFKNNPEIFFANLMTACKTKIRNQLRDEHELQGDPDCDDVLRFIVTDLDVDKHDRDVIGDLQILCNSIWPDGRFPVPILYRAIGEQLEARSAFEGLPATVGELLAKKAISSTEVQTFFDKIAHEPRLTILWQTAHQVLMSEKIVPLEIHAYQRGWYRYGIEREDPKNLTVRQLQRRIRITVRDIIENGGPASYTEIVQVASEKIGEVPQTFRGWYLNGAILLEFFDEPNWELSPADPESTGEAP